MMEGPLQPTDPMAERPSVEGPASTPSPWIGWAILALVGLVVSGGGWALVRVLDGRARPALPAVTPSSASAPSTGAP